MNSRLLPCISLCLMLISSCASSAPPRSRLLPFKVAVAPILQVEVIDDTADLDGEGRRMKSTPELIAQLNEQLEQELVTSCFADLVALAPPANSVDPAGGAPSDLEWLELASRNTDADLLLTFRLRHGTAIHEETNEFIYSAIPFSYLPGPQMWGVPDRRYRSNCILTVNLFDLERFKQYGQSLPPGNRLWYFTHSVPLGYLYSSFANRVGWNLHYYLVGLICPSVVLGFEKDDFEQELNERIMESLATLMGRALRARSLDVVRNEHDYSFFLEDRRTRLEFEGQEQVRVEFSLGRRTANHQAPLRRVSLVADEEGSPVTLIEDWTRLAKAKATSGDQEGYERFQFSELVKISPGTRCLRLIVEVGESPVALRRYSLPLPRPADQDGG